MKPKNFSKDELKLPEEQFGTLDASEPASHIGIILGILIILLMLVLAALYAWGTYLQEQRVIEVPDTQRPTAEENNEPESNNAEADVETAAALSPSDEITALEADLEATNVETIDSDITAIEAVITP